MPKIEYVPRRFSDKSLAIIENANTIIEEYQKQGFELTLRQLYYQFVSRDLITNTQREYKNLGSIVNDARLAGLIDWDTIIDRTRNLEKNPQWHNAQQFLRSVIPQFQVDRWENQPNRVEVWIEKDALIGVIEKICQRHDVAYFSCRGYTSQSEMWSAAQRLIEYTDNGQELTILHLGDHDPSGKDMTRDIQSRLELFGARVDVRRIALNMSQVRTYNPPPNPCKITDSRAEGYIAEFGTKSWELDALEPQVIADLIQDNLKELRDNDLWQSTIKSELSQLRKLEKAAKALT